MIIVFGGAFNPPTNAHYEMIKTLKTEFRDAKIICLPVGNHYPKPDLIAFHHRYEMLQLMCEDFNDVDVSDFENQTHYQGTLKSLKHFEKTYQDQAAFVIGSDHLSTLNTWINYKELLKDHICIIMNRDGYLSYEDAENMYKDTPHHFVYLEFSHLIASHKIRENLDFYQDYLNPKVKAYIKRHQLYQKESSHV